MKLHVDFDDDLVKRYMERGRSPVFTIYWTQDQVAYPEDGWMDFGSVILSWWLVAAKSLLGGMAEADLPFMDGPFRLKAHLIGNLLYVSADDQSWQWHIPMVAFVNELLKGANQVQRKFDELGVFDEEGLQDGARSLRIAMSSATTTAAGSRTVQVEHVA